VAWAGRLHDALVGVLRDWGPYGVARRVGGRWRGSGDPDPGDGFAVWSEARGVRALLPAIVGAAHEVRVEGPDTIPALARVDLLPPAERPPIEQLDAEEEDWLRWRAARALGEGGANPRPVVPVVLRGASEADIRRRLLRAMA
jgi:hypothetical protein